MEKKGNKRKQKEADVGNLPTSGCSEKPKDHLTLPTEDMRPMLIHIIHYGV